jgi:hypothetical protein
MMAGRLVQSLRREGSSVSSMQGKKITYHRGIYLLTKIIIGSEDDDDTCQISTSVESEGGSAYSESLPNINEVIASPSVAAAR